MHFMAFLLLVMVLLAQSLLQVRALGCGDVVNGAVTIPASVTSIDNNAFLNCYALTSVSFVAGSQLTSIGRLAFAGSGLTSIIIPAFVTGIAD